MPQLTPEEIDAYLDGPHVAHFASIRPNGAPHISPVWYHWQRAAGAGTATVVSVVTDDAAVSVAIDRPGTGPIGTVTVVSGHAAVKTRNIRRNPQAALSIATDEWPYQYVILEGSATVRTDHLKDAVRSIFSRYEGAERGEQDATELTEGAQQLVAIEIAVHRILSWKGDDQ